MITTCGGPDFVGLTEKGFALDTLVLLVVVIPTAGVFVLWRLFVTNKSQVVQQLALGDVMVDDHRATILSSWLALLISLTTAVLALLPGVLIWEVFMLLVKTSLDNI